MKKREKMNKKGLQQIIEIILLILLGFVLIIFFSNIFFKFIHKTSENANANNILTINRFDIVKVFVPTDTQYVLAVLVKKTSGKENVGFKVVGKNADEEIILSKTITPTQPKDYLREQDIKVIYLKANNFFLPGQQPPQPPNPNPNPNPQPRPNIWDLRELWVIPLFEDFVGPEMGKCNLLITPYQIAYGETYEYLC